MTTEEVTDDAFLGGALGILQPRRGYRAGVDAVLLGASVGSLSTGQGMRVVDLGAGVGTAGLCLARRLPQAEVTLVERELELVALAAENIRRNGLDGRVRVVAGDIAEKPNGLGDVAPGSFEVVVANPPFHSTAEGSLAPVRLKARAHAMEAGELETWARAMARYCAADGAAHVIHKAECLGELLGVLAGRFGALKVLPIHAFAEEPAIRVLVTGRKGSRAPMSLLPGFVLHAPDRSFTPMASEILRNGAALAVGVGQW